MKYGFFSKQAFDRQLPLLANGIYDNRGCIYLTPEGKEVLVTMVSKEKNWKKTSYAWEDTVYVGPVTEFVREIK